MKSTSIKALSILLITLIFGCSSEKEAAKTLPQLTTTTATSVTLTAASTGGNVSADGGAPVTSRGVVWSTATSPTISLATKTTDGLGTGSFSSSIANLNPSTNYYVRAYATNSVGTAYGNEITFTTGAIVLPTLTSTAITSITTNSAVSGGTISADGGGSITARGVVWSTSTSPTITLSTKTTDGSGKGIFTSTISGLVPNTTYYIRAYATNKNGTGYGNEYQFKTTLAPITSGNGFLDINGNSYTTLVIDNKEWASKNLAVKKYKNGDIIPQVQNPNEWTNLTTGAWCYYNNDPANEKYGLLYNWYAVNDSRGLAPQGWHVPTDTEWDNLQRFLITAGYNYDGDLKIYNVNLKYNDKLGKSIAAKTFKKHTISPLVGSPASIPTENNRTNFSALGSGLRGSDANFNDIDEVECWWTTTTYTSSNNIYVKYRNIVSHLQHGLDNNGGALRTSGFSVRLIKN